jgi:hypothetical protein
MKRSLGQARPGQYVPLVHNFPFKAYFPSPGAATSADGSVGGTEPDEEHAPIPKGALEPGQQTRDAQLDPGPWDGVWLRLRGAPQETREPAAVRVERRAHVPGPAASSCMFCFAATIVWRVDEPIKIQVGI